MADVHNEAREDATMGKKKKSPVVLILVIVILLLIAGGAVAGYFLFIAPQAKPAAPAAQAAPAVQDDGQLPAGSAGAGLSGPMRQMDSFIVNLTDAQGTRYLKVVMQLEMSNELLGTEIDKKTPQIRDEVIMLLSSKSFDDVSTMAGKRALKRAILNSINKYLVTGRVLRVYFSDFVVQ